MAGKRTKSTNSGSTSKPSNSKAQTTPKAKKTGGGTAIGGGVNFQAVVTAIVGVHILRGAALGWLNGVCIDLPIAVWAESEGPGDDLHIELDNDLSIEVQAKKGLVRGENLWGALESIAGALHKGQMSYGLLAIASDSSSTISKELATDIERLGQGRTDSLKDIGKDWAGRLTKANIPAQKVCRCMRIRVIHGLSAEDADANAAKEILRHVCAREDDVEAAWNTLCRHAVLLIEKRGRWTLQDLVRLLRSTNIAIRNDNFPASLLDRHTAWVSKINEHFAITGIRRRIPLMDLLPMQLESMAFKQSESSDASAALERYHKSAEHKRFSDVFDSIWTARFKTRAVVVAGPGLGKSTMLKELAHQYAQDGYLVLKVALKPIAAAMRHGGTFSDLLLKHSLDGIDITSEQIKYSKRFNWVVLADGLDECGSTHREVAEQINRFAEGHPLARIVLTTRPIGYDTPALEHWTHYRLLPPVTGDGAANLARLVSAASKDELSPSGAVEVMPYKPGKMVPSDAIAISPQLLGMSAALIHRHRELPKTRLGLYSELIKLFEEFPADSPSEQPDIAVIVLDIIGWHLLYDPLITFDLLLDQTATALSPLTGRTALASKNEVRAAVKHWERVGLVEQIFHGDTKLLTFIHKTFCEFVASRYLVRHSELIDRLVDQVDKQEVISFAVGQGLAEELIALYVRRYDAGRPKQLQSALTLLNKQQDVIPERCAQALIQRSFAAIEDGAAERFSIGLSISRLGGKASHFAAAEATPRLQSTDPAVKLVAWAIVLNCGITCYDPARVTPVLRGLLLTVDPFDAGGVFDKKDRSDHDLLRRVAIGVLKAQPDENIRFFAIHELSDEKLSSIGFISEVNDVLRSRGVEELPSLWPKAESKYSPVTVTPVGIRWEEASIFACRSIAGAFANDLVPDAASRKYGGGFPQFAGLMRASGFMDMPGSDVYQWAKPHDELATQSIIKAVAALLPLDVNALAEEANAILQQLDTEAPESAFAFLPAVDILPLAWETVPNAPDGRDHIKRALLHPSAWINQLAAKICERTPMTQAELQSLMSKAAGYSLFHISLLTAHHHSNDAPQMLVQRLTNDAAGDVSGIFTVLRGLGISPSPELMNLTLICLCSDDEASSEAATNLLSHWHDKGTLLDRAPISTAVDHWGGGDGRKSNLFTRTPLHSLRKLLDKIDTGDTHSPLSE